jgi:uncharacterized protein YraI
MKRRILVALLVCAALLVPVATALAQGPVTFTPDVTLRLREGPSVGYTQIGMLPAGVPVTALGRDAVGYWAYVDAQGVRGWAAAWLATVDGDLNTLPVTQPDGTGALPMGEVSAQAVCDPRSTPIQPNTSVMGHIDATDEGYPANCAYYCLWLPQEAGTLDVTLANYSEDLDLYAISGELDPLLINDTSTAYWLSNSVEPTEMVSIPGPGVSEPYYFEVCSYNSTATDFTLTTATR